MKSLVGLTISVLLVILIQSGNARQALTARQLEEIEELEDLLAERRSHDIKDKVKSAFEDGEKKLKRLEEKQKELKEKGVDGKKKKGHRNKLSKTSKKSIERQEVGFMFLDFVRSLVESTGKTTKELAADPDVQVAIKDYISGESGSRRRRQTENNPCNPAIDCESIPNVDQYRTFDGICNNKQNPLYGSAFSTQPRFEGMDAVYSDGVDAPRKSVSGNDLPSARNLSNEIFQAETDITDPEDFNTLMSMNWGQFLDHDIVITPTISGADGVDITCCTVEREECMDISMNWDPNNPDPHFKSTCMEFVRSAPAPVCGISAKQVSNEITSFIDASNVYGSSKAESDALRAVRGGELSAFLDMRIGSKNRELLPEDSSDDAICSLSGNDATDYCQKAGDVRVNVQPGLGSLHLVFAKEHNRIVTKLAEVQPEWSQEKLFNEARKIIGALMQHITYSDYFINLFGPVVSTGKEEVASVYGLNLLESGFYQGYDETIDPSIRVGFATAAFRFGHSQIPHVIAYMGSDFNSITKETKMENTLKDPHMLIFKAGGKVADLVRYMTTETARKTDRYFESSVRNTLFGDFDLGSLNIQRGRDHGLPSYVEWRKFCGLSTPANGQDWEGLVDIPGRLIRQFQRSGIYEDVNDIDLYVGGLAEIKLTQYLGPTFACILGKQFEVLRKGDRFWYERPAPEGFTDAQLTEIRKVQLSHLLCNHAEINAVQRNVFRRQIKQGATTKKVDCAEFEKNQMDFSKWAQ